MMEIDCARGVDATVTVPGSKSYTQRALVVAALAEGESVVEGALLCEDSAHLIRALQALGAGVYQRGKDLLVRGTGGRVRNPHAPIYLGDNGTAMRILTSVVCLGEGVFELTGSARLCQRPMEPLLRALRELGVDAWSKRGDGAPPVIVRAQGFPGGGAVFGELQSSQFVSSLLIAAPLAKRDTRIDLMGRVPSFPYTDMTVRVMEEFGVKVTRSGQSTYWIAGGQRYIGRAYRVEGDLSSASYFFAAAAVCKGRVRVENVNPDSAQGDVKFLGILESLGCRVTRGEHWIEAVREGPLTQGDMTLDMGEMPDVVPTLSVIAAVRSGRTVIKGVGHLRVKESDRLAALVTELRKTGVVAEEIRDGLAICGGRPHGAQIDTYNDHRMAMSFAVLGLAVPGIRLVGTGCVKKSFPNFWTELKRLSVGS
jgi:3-phosphoshikimate 1-carboxyvinyltransferase